MVTEEIIVKYINYLKGYEEDGVIPIEEKLSGATINNHLTVLANFYQTLADFEVFEGQVPFSFVEGFKPAETYRGFLYHAAINKNKTKKHKLKVSVTHMNCFSKKGD